MTRRLAHGAVMAAALGASLLHGSQARADEAKDFYANRSVTLTIGYSVGGGYDLYARLLAPFLARHLPGGPTVVPQNMPGAGSLKAANYLYAVAPKDGSAIGTFGRSIALQPLFGDPSAAFDGTKFTWIGSVTNDVSLCVTWSSSPIRTWNDFVTKSVTLGGEGAGADPDVFALTIKNVFGAHIKLVTGFPGTADTALAMERGEIDGLCGLSYSTLRGRHADWVTGRKVHLVVQAALQKEPELPDVPLILDLAKTDEQRRVLRLIVASQSMARPYAAPPGIPADRKAALRQAFDAAVRDPDLLAQAKKTDIDVNPVSGAALDQLVGELYATPKEIVEKAARAMAN